MSSERLDAETVETALLALLERHPDALVAAVDPDGMFTELPASLPLDRHRVMQVRSGIEVVSAPDRVVVIEAWDRARAAGSARASVHLLRDPDGEPVNMHFFDARPTHGVYMCIVVTKNPDEAITGIHANPAIPPRVCRITKNDTAIITAVDAATTAILGWSPDEMVGRRSLDFIHPDDADRAIENWMEMLGATSQRVRLRHLRKDGSWVWIEITNDNRLDDPEQACVVAETIDISDEMAIHEALRAREQLLRRLAEALPTGLFQIAVDRSIVYTNDRLHQIVGIGALTSLDEQLAAVELEDRPALHAAVDAVLAGEDRDIEVHLRLPASGDRRLCQLNLRSLTDDDGTVNGAIVTVADVTEAAQLRRELERRATLDALTGCHNRASVMAALERHLSGTDQAMAVVFVDLDHFKAVNDDLGHAAGDELLVLAADRLRDATRTGDVVGRLGGDEFLVLCPGVADRHEAEVIGDRVARALRHHVLLAAGPVDLQASVGVAHTGDGPAVTSADELVARADAAMYRSKDAAVGEAVVAGEHWTRPSGS
jgi:diguanylate cyclase (GGDEF)-like protein/PAS domain S-box-containing protein